MISQKYSRCGPKIHILCLDVVQGDSNDKGQKYVVAGPMAENMDFRLDKTESWRLSKKDWIMKAKGDW